ncbi:MAG: flagellar FlbD family protein [Acidobacteria bacterium]|nr:flagellar FlbD family protein [Acidobacteriota bacterium]MBI3655381.1 flagellar FlbD family protein [Acidobacteriota bacterium]
MIKLTKLNQKESVVNSDLIQYIESTPDTVITLINGEKHVVLESVDDVIEKIIAYKRKVLSGLEILHQCSDVVPFVPILVENKSETK